MYKTDFLFCEAVFSAYVSSAEIGIDFVSYDPLKMVDVVLKQVGCLCGGVRTEEKSVYVFATSGIDVEATGAIFSTSDILVL